MINQFSRTELIIGKNNIERINKSKVVLFGLGGVGSYVLEGLARAGVGHFILVDDDTVSVTNINRQIIATTKTIGENKVDVAKKRVLDINPDAIVETKQMFFMPDTEDFFDSTIDYIIDAVDTVTAKLEIIERAKKHNIPVISCMGTGNKMSTPIFPQTSVTSNRIIYTPSEFAKTSLLHLQETGELKAERPHTNSRSGLDSYLFFIVISGSGNLIYDDATYKLKTNDCVFIVKSRILIVHQITSGSLNGYISMAQTYRIYMTNISAGAVSLCLMRRIRRNV